MRIKSKYKIYNSSYHSISKVYINSILCYSLRGIFKKRNSTEKHYVVEYIIKTIGV